MDEKKLKAAMRNLAGEKGKQKEDGDSSWQKAWRCLDR